jgi:hypothetical protein
MRSSSDIVSQAVGSFSNEARNSEARTKHQVHANEISKNGAARRYGATLAGYAAVKKDNNHNRLPGCSVV